MPRAKYDHDRIAELYYSVGPTKAAEEVGCTYNMVYYVAYKRGLLKRGPLRGRPRHHGSPLGIPYRKKSTQGYIQLCFRYWKNGKRRMHYVLEHRVVMERKLGRPLTSKEQVHHQNGVRDDNRPENLDLMSGAHPKGPTHCRHCGELL